MPPDPGDLPVPTTADQFSVPDVLSLDHLVAMSLSHNPAIQQAAATAQKARGVRRQIDLCPNPIIGYSGEEMGDNGTAGMQGAFLSQTIVLGDKLHWNRCVADQQVQSLLWQVESQRYRVRNDVRRQFYETLGAQQRLILADELVRIAEDGLKNATTLQQANQAALPDVLQAKVQLREVEIIRQNTAFEYEASWDVLAALVGVPELDPVPLDDVLEAEQPIRDRGTAWAQIITISPQLRQAYANVQSARVQIQRENVQPIPNLQVDVGVMHMNPSDDNAASLMLGIPVPIFNANEGNIDRATAEYHRASWNAQRLEMSLKAQLATAFSQYQQALNRAVTFRDQILPAETQTLNLIEAAYPLQFEFLRLLTARRSYFEARMQYLDALVDLRVAEVALDGLLLSGGLNSVPDTSFDDTLRGRAFNGQ
jgi:cobalt-zinc-cadmium efflux system outer membrane protein